MLTQVRKQNFFYLETATNIIYYSYSTPIAVYDRESDTLCVNCHNYSVTTSKHMNTLKKWHQGATIVSMTPNALNHLTAA